MIDGKRLRLNLLSPRIVLARSEPTGRCCIFGAYFDGQLAHHFGAIRERAHRVVLVAILSCIEREYLVLHVLIATEVTIVLNLSVVVCQPSKVNLS